MTAYLLPLLCAVFVWWFGTGAVLYADGLPAAARRRMLIGATGLALGALTALALVAAETTALAAYLGFVAGIVLWGWNELLFLSGHVTGPNRSFRPPEARGWRRFTLAAGTLIYHEIALVATAGAMLALTWGAANQVGLWTFALLFAMRLSTKLNIFFGVPNMSEEMLPPNVAYLKSHFGPRRLHPFFALSVFAATALVAWLIWRASTTGAAAGAAPGAGFEHAALSLMAALALLGLIEHWLLVLPVRDSALWRWAMRASDQGPAQSGQPGRTPVASRADYLNGAGGAAPSPGNGRLS